MVVPPDADRWLLVGGELDPAAATGTLDEVAVRDRVTAAARRQREEHLATVAAGRLAPVGHLLLRREDGHVVGRAPVEWYPADEGAFFQALPWAEDTFAVQLVIGEQVLAERRVSPAPPVVSEVAASVGAGRRVEVTWAASDPDGDPLSALVQWSADGESWLPVLAGVEQGRAVVEPGRGFPGGPEVRVRVEVSDGLRTATATSPPFTAPGHGPVAVVTGLEDGARVDRHDLVELWAQAIDPEEGMLDEELSWRSSRDGVLGQGRILSTRRLSVGEHQIEVFGEDGDGNEARAGLTVTVAPPAEPPRFLEEPDQDGVAFLRGVRTFSGDRTRERAGLYGAMGMLAVAGLGVTTHLFRRAHAGRGGG